MELPFLDHSSLVRRLFYAVSELATGLSLDGRELGWGAIPPQLTELKLKLSKVPTLT